VFNPEMFYTLDPSATALPKSLKFIFRKSIA